MAELCDLLIVTDLMSKAERETRGENSNSALDQLRAQDYPVLNTDAERLSALIRDTIGIDGHYAFHLPDRAGTHRLLRDPDRSDDN